MEERETHSKDFYTTNAFRLKLHQRRELRLMEWQEGHLTCHMLSLVEL